MTTNGAGADCFRPGPLEIVVTPVVETGVMLDHMRSALRRDLPAVRRCRPHVHVLCVAGGGPSLEDTYRDLDGYVAAINGSLRWLLEQGIRPNACGVLDPGDHIADMIEACADVTYFVASMCHPSVFDKLAGCHVVLWHASGTPGAEDVVNADSPDDWVMIGGGSTMGVRWLNLGYVMGFRSFDFHGLDSSFRGNRTHAYPDRRDGNGSMRVGDYDTSLNFMAQVMDFRAVLKRFDEPDMDPTEVRLHGDGLLQSELRRSRT